MTDADTQPDALTITVVGPCTPAVFADDLGVHDVSALPDGLVGTPVNGLVRGLLDAGHRVHVVTASPDLSESADFSGSRLSLHAVPYRSRARDRALDLFASERAAMRAGIKLRESDVIHAHWTYEFAWAAMGVDRPLVVTAHDSPFTILRSLKDSYRALRTLMAIRVRLGTKHLTAVSPYLARKWRRQMLFRRPIAVVPNVSPFARSEGAPLHAAPVVVDIADASDRKNVWTLLQGFDHYRKTYPDATLLLIGGGLEDDAEFASRARSANLGGNVEFVGQAGRSAVKAALRRATMLVHPSLEESQPMSLLEGMAHGVPIIGGHMAGGVPWTLGDGEAGLLVDVRSPTELSEAMRHLTSDPALRQSLVEAGWDLIDTRYSTRAVAESYVSVYRRAIDATVTKRSASR